VKAVGKRSGVEMKQNGLGVERCILRCQLEEGPPLAYLSYLGPPRVKGSLPAATGMSRGKRGGNLVRIKGEGPGTRGERANREKGSALKWNSRKWDCLIVDRSKKEEKIAGNGRLRRDNSERRKLGGLNQIVSLKFVMDRQKRGERRLFVSEREVPENGTGMQAQRRGRGLKGEGRERRKKLPSIRSQAPALSLNRGA